MLNNINDTTFKANFRVSTPVKDTARLKNIQRIFSENTTQYKEVLSLSKIEDFGINECLYAGTKPEKSNVVSFTESFDSIMERLSDNDIVTKLIKTLKAIKALNKREFAGTNREWDKYRAQHEKERNLRIAESCRENGDEIMAQRFQFLADCFNKKLTKIELQRQKDDTSFLKALAKIADGDEDILNFSNNM